MVMRRIPPAAFALSALWVVLLAAWSLLAPLSRAPDEPGHADLMFHLADGGTYPAWNARNLSRGVLTVVVAHQSRATGLKLTEREAPPRAARPTFAAAGGDRPTPLPNQIAQHPPLYYELGAVALRAEHVVIRPMLEREWHGLRLLNVLLLAPLSLLAFLTARRLLEDERTALAAAAVPLAIPQLLHVGAAINNDNLLTLLASALALLLAGVLRGDTGRRTAVTIGVLGALALLTKAFAFAFLAWIPLAYVVAARRGAGRSALTGGALATGIALAGGGWWWLRHLIHAGSLSPSIADRLYAKAPAGFTPDLSFYVPRAIGHLAQSFWGDFGFLEAPLPVVAVALASGVVVVATVAAATRPGRRLELAALGSLFALLLALVLVQAYDRYARSGLTPFLYGRYLFPAVVPLAAIVGSGAVRLLGERAPLAILGGAVAMQAVAVHTAFATWWYGWGALVAWNPWPSVVPWLLAAALAASLAAAVAALIRPVRRGRMSAASP